MANAKVGGFTQTIDANFTRPNDTTAYAAGDAVTNSTSAPTAITFTECGQVKGGSGIILRAQMFDSANQSTKGQFELWLFDTSPTPDNDNAAFTPTDAENRTLVGIFSFNTAKVGDATAGGGGNCVYEADERNIPFKCAHGAANLFGLVKASSAYTPVAQERFDFRLNIAQD